ncbi:periphilin-1-like [Engraulis encrasicolus]|uniref:periphilin-1-like n=1 Tax=Engraulis encrasicolus TaxID=184585 RepID=UPI002FD35E8D
MSTRSQYAGGYNKPSSTRHRERTDEPADKRSSGDNPIKRVGGDDNRPFRRLRSPTGPSRPFRPRFGGRFYRPRFIPFRDRGFFRRPSIGFHRQHSPHHNLRSPALRHKVSSPSRPDARPSPSPSPSEQSKATSRASGDSVREERSSLSFTVSRQSKVSQGRDPPSAVTRAAARSRAIQKKRREIEEVYRQDCDTFGVVVKMLIAKDPSLERPIQSSLQENLREIGLRCVEAMQDFIQDYDARQVCPSPTPTPPHPTPPHATPPHPPPPPSSSSTPSTPSSQAPAAPPAPPPPAAQPPQEVSPMH